MQPAAVTMHAYREQLQRCARALAAARIEAVGSDLAADATPSQVKLFTDGNFEKRWEKLNGELEFVADWFENFGDLLQDYIRRVPLDAYSSGPEDADRFLQWLSKRRLTPEQRDIVTCQRSRHALELAARENRLGHVRFQELHSVSEQLAPEWGCDEDLRLHLNPIRIWATFRTPALLDGAATTPAQVLFFPVGNEIHTAVLEAEGRELVRHLEIWGPCRLDELTHRGDDAGRAEIIDLCHDLVDMGLAAFG